MAKTRLGSYGRVRIGAFMPVLQHGSGFQAITSVVAGVVEVHGGSTPLERL